jgi:thiamine monophosphate kinase
VDVLDGRVGARDEPIAGRNIEDGCVVTDPVRARAPSTNEIANHVELATGAEGNTLAQPDHSAIAGSSASTDATVENVHFRREWLAPSEIGYRAATAALSDLAAMAAVPVAMLVAMSVPERWREQLGGIAEGIGDASRSFNAPITGGNLTTGSELSLTVTVLGYAARPLARDLARGGDAVYVTGLLGGPGRALAAWESGGALCKANGTNS